MTIWDTDNVTDIFTFGYNFVLKGILSSSQTIFPIFILPYQLEIIEEMMIIINQVIYIEGREGGREREREEE